VVQRIKDEWPEPMTPMRKPTFQHVYKSEVSPVRFETSVQGQPPAYVTDPTVRSTGILPAVVTLAGSTVNLH
jgi:hypothetical protein